MHGNSIRNQKMGRNTGPSRRQPSGPAGSAQCHGTRKPGARDFHVLDQGSAPWASAARRSTDDGDGCVGGDDIVGGDAVTSATRARVLSNPARAAVRGERRAAHNVFDTLRPRRACLAASPRPVLASPLLSSPACATRAGTMNALVDYVGSTLPLPVHRTPPTCHLRVC